jgi:ADP-heptose:LPS heptosyltransferase
MIKTTYKGWRVLFNGDEAIYDIMDDIIRKNIQGRVLQEIKNNRRSRVLLITYNGGLAVLKSPREKNHRKWIRFTTLYRQGEAFKVIRNLNKLERMGIVSNKPLLAMEKRRFGMVVDSWLLYEYLEGRHCRESDYPSVANLLARIHAKNMLHGDPHINNFLRSHGQVVTIDCNPKFPLFGTASKVYEYLYLQHSAPGIEQYFKLTVNSGSYRLAALYSNLYWSWRRHKKSSRQRKKEKLKFLVIRLSSIGDIILTTPVLDAIRQKYPDAVIDFLVMDTYQDAVSGNTNLDNLIIFKKESFKGLGGIYRFARTLKDRRYDVIIDLHAKIRSILISFFLGGRILRYKKRAFWKSLLVPLRLVRYRVDDTIVRNYFKPLQKLHVYFTKESLTFNYNEDDVRRVEKLGNRVVMAPGALNHTKQWPTENFAALGKMLNEEIVLIGGETEFAQLEEIRRLIGSRCVNLAGKLSLKESGALISRSKYIITNDSAPFHMARGVSTKAFVIFGPTDPGMFEYDHNAVPIISDTPCAPCSLHGDKKCPKGHFDCMNSLTPEKVYQIIKNEIV